MFGSPILEVAVGVMFIFALVSIVCTSVREGIEAWLKTRSAYLEHGIRELLHDKGADYLARHVYTHPLIYGLYSGDYNPQPSRPEPALLARGGNLPSYIPSRNFALALMDIAARGPITDSATSGSGTPPLSLEAMRANIRNLQNPAVQRLMLHAIDAAEGDIDRAQASIMNWFDTGMDRVSGWYKRTTQWILFAIGLFVAVALNVNTITIVDYLSRNDVARSALVTAAAQNAAAPATSSTQEANRQARQTLDSTSLPIGWSAGWGAPRRGNEPVSGGSLAQAWNYVLGPILGWLITAFAATLGAPFWFDLLNKVMVIRSTVKPHEKSPEESSEDRQAPAAPAASAAPVTEGTVTVITAGATMSAAPSLLNSERAKDRESDVDGCDVAAAGGKVTLDHELPAASGGVQ